MQQSIVLKHCKFHKVSECNQDHSHSGPSLHLFVPQWLYHETARCFTQFNGEAAALGEHYLLKLQLFGYLANKLNQEKNGRASVVLQHVTNANGLRSCGYLMQLTIAKDGESTFGTLLHALMVKNRARMDEEASKRQPKGAPMKLAYEKLTQSLWKQVCVTHDPNRMECYPHDSPVNVAEDTNEFHPLMVFTLESALREIYQHREPLANPEFYDVKQYEEGEFPVPERAYHIAVDDLLPENLSRRLFPWVPKPVKRNDRIKTAFCHSKMPAEFVPDSSCTTEAQREANIRQKQEAAFKRYAALFDEMFNVAPTTDKDFDIHAMKEKMQEDMDRVPVLVAARLEEERKEKEDGSPEWEEKRRMELFREEQHKVREANIEIFDSMIFTDDPNAAVADSLKAIRRWEINRLETHRNLCMPRPKVTSDLSYGMEGQALFAVMLEVCVGVNTVHTQIILVELAGKQVYSRTNFHNHVLLAGAPRAGKTFTFEVMYKFWVDGTARMYTYATPKAKTSATRSFDSMIEIFEEIPPTMLGISSLRGGAQSAPTNSSDAEAILKSLMTTGKMSLASVQIVDGVRTPVDITIDCNSVLMAACNNYRDQVAPAIVSRYDFHSVSIKERFDNGGIVGAKMRSENKTDEMRRNYQKAKARVQRDQSMAARVQSMIYVGLLPEVDMSVANVIMAQVLRRAKELHLTGVGDVRNLERVVMLTKTVAISDAINVLFDSCVSPLLGKDWNSRDLFLIEKHLKANVDHVVYALGLLEHQYENKIMYRVIGALQDNIFGEEFTESKNKRENFMRTGRALASLRSPSQSTADYMQVEATETVNCKTTEHALEVLSRVLHSKMDPQPAEGDIKGILRDLTRLPITTDTGVVIPALEFYLGQDNNRMSLRMALSVAEHNKPDKLKQVITEVLCHPHACNRTVLYPQPNELLPYIHQTIEQRPNPRAKQLVAAEPRYMDTALITFNASYTSGVDATMKEERQYIMDPSLMYALNDELDVDADLDDWGTEVLNTRLGITQSEIDQMPSNNPAIQMQQIMAATGNANRLKPYLQSFTRLRKEEFEERRKRRRDDRPEDFSMSNAIQESARRRAGTAFEGYSYSVPISPNDRGNIMEEDTNVMQQLGYMHIAA